MAAHGEANPRPGEARLSHWQRLKKAFKSTKVVQGNLQQEPAQLGNQQEQCNTPSWLIRARTGAYRDPQVWGTTLVNIPDEVGAAKPDALRGCSSSTTPARMQSSRSTPASKSSRAGTRGQSCGLLDTCPEEVMHKHKRSFSSRLRRHLSTSSLVLDTPAHSTSQSMLETRGSNSILVSARGVLATNSSQISTLPPLSLDTSTTPGLMLASARANPQSQCTVGVGRLQDLQAEVDEEEQWGRSGLCGLGRRPATIPKPCRPVPALEQAPDGRAPSASFLTLRTTPHTAAQSVQQTPSKSSWLAKKTRQELGAPAKAAVVGGSPQLPSAPAASPRETVACPLQQGAAEEDHASQHGSADGSFSSPRSGSSALSVHDSVCSVSANGADM